jgi:hypothetical protein
LLPPALLPPDDVAPPELEPPALDPPEPPEELLLPQATDKQTIARKKGDVVRVFIVSSLIFIVPSLNRR